MDLNTLTLYLVAGGLSLMLSLVMISFARLQPGTRAIRSCAAAILILAIGFIGAGYGNALPRWMTVMGTNMVLVGATAVLYSGFSAWCNRRPATIDHVGWGVVALTALPFWYWGLIEPNGNYRSIIFSVAVAINSARTARLLIRDAKQHGGDIAVWIMGSLFGVLTLWMVGRALFLLFADPVPIDLRGINPTRWVTVFWYIILMALMAAGVLWMEVNRLSIGETHDARRSKQVFSIVEYFRNKLLLLWVSIVILTIGIISELGIAYTTFHQTEKTRLIQSAELANDAFVAHTLQIANQVDTLLHSVRGFYLRTRSIDETEAFIQSLGFDRSIIDNIYLISAAGQVLISHDQAAKERSIADREYFAFHRATADDRIFISSVEPGRITGKQHFRYTRRINRPDGSFGGLVLATVDPESFTRYYRDLGRQPQAIASLLGIIDKKLRARVPLPPDDIWQAPVESPLWSALEKSSSGLYQSISGVDGIYRTFVFKKVGDLPLVMVTGFSDTDLQQNLHDRMRWLLVSTVIILLVVFLLATLLTVEIRRREEQERFMSMLNHELKTPLSTIGITLGSNEVPDVIKGRIARSISAMNAVIERCLQADRLQQGQVNIALANCGVAALLEDIRTACVGPERLSIHAGNLPVVRTDSQLLGVILGNLIDNALKYSPSASRVTIRAEASHKGILMAISNLPGAAGMPDPEQVFRKYYRAPGAHGKTGSGLGLHIAAGFAKKLGGNLRYQPMADVVRFELWIPA
jgi:signal transduction histidine kinase